MRSVWNKPKTSLHEIRKKNERYEIQTHNLSAKQECKEKFYNNKNNERCWIRTHHLLAEKEVKENM